MSATEDKLRELLLPVFGLENISEIPATASLVKDIGADSLDFVEIFYIIDRNFGVTLSSKEVIIGGFILRPEELFVDGVVTAEKAAELHARIPEAKERIVAGMTRAQMFSGITVSDLAAVVDLKKAAQG